MTHKAPRDGDIALPAASVCIAHDMPAVFAAGMSHFTPFETAPRIAVAVSGGSDSLALAHLAHAWARRHGGDVRGIIIDHALRDGSAADARHAHDVLASFGMGSDIVRWDGEKPAHRVQETARSARYHLLQKTCAQHGILHLLTGHSRDDLFETVAMRAARGDLSPIGARGIPACRYMRDVRVLRPLLAATRAELKAYCADKALPYVSDPANANPAFERVRTRAQLEKSKNEPALSAVINDGVQRTHAMEAELAAALARYVTLLPPRAAYVSPHVRNVPFPVMAAMLGRVIAVLAGDTYPPARAKLDFAAQAVLAGRGCTLGGIRLHPDTGKRGGTWVFPETRSAPPPVFAALQTPFSPLKAARYGEREKDVEYQPDARLPPAPLCR